MRMGEDQHEAIQVYSTGSLTLDIALGIGGLPHGRVVEIYGPQSTGKTTIALQAIAKCQKGGGVAAFRIYAYEASRARAEDLGISEFFQEYRSKTGTIAVLDCETMRPVAILNGERDIGEYRKAISRASRAS